MIIRVPNSGKPETERLKLITHFEKKLGYFGRIPAWRRDAECADAGEATCQMMLTELGLIGNAPAKGTPEITVGLMTMNEFFSRDHD